MITTTRWAKGVSVARLAGSRTSARRATAATPALAHGAKLAPALQQASALGAECPLPDGVVNKFVNGFTFEEKECCHCSYER